MLAFRSSDGSNCFAYAPTSVDKCAQDIVCPEERGLSSGLTMINHLEQDLMASFGINSFSSALSMQDEEFNCLFEQLDGWDHALESVDPASPTQRASSCTNADEVTLHTSGSTCSTKEKITNVEKQGFYQTNQTKLAFPTGNLIEGSSSTELYEGVVPSLTKSVPSSSVSKSSASPGSNEAGKSSRNLILERRRRKQLNERLYSLRTLVPKISKMDKASIVSDAIDYVRELQEQVETIQKDINRLQFYGSGSQRLPSSNIGRISASKSKRKKLPDHQVLELDVSNMEEQTYQLRIHCRNGPGVLVQLTKALESLDLEIMNANMTVLNGHVLNNVVVKIGNVTSGDQLKKLILNIIPRFGLTF
ncbi:hypothetical protein KP509_04G071300 [Ceratopteris richardii]|uniref:BHLH domain-containing protein n=1 Tax=Ceratopteris richardii TaxID=49495 RepID=A0A8T2UWM5_CERRI|nr:hypothetical protein KP509_04G071300 [Ceratopteris richardii]KAH7439662.1 hypothetical protein KP509_04G071300 [Ceratopteris richardii]